MAFGLVARDATGVLSPFSFPLRDKRVDDIILKILYCGICHTDLSIIKNEWGNARYPVVPGHEIVGVVTEVGSSVQKFKVGDNVGVFGLGGLGHLAVKFAKAFGAKVTVISTNINQKKGALEKLGADSFIFNRDHMKAWALNTWDQLAVKRETQDQEYRGKTNQEDWLVGCCCGRAYPTA